MEHCKGQRSPAASAALSACPRRGIRGGEEGPRGACSHAWLQTGVPRRDGLSAMLLPISKVKWISSSLSIMLNYECSDLLDILHEPEDVLSDENCLI